MNHATAFLMRKEMAHGVLQAERTTRRRKGGLSCVFVEVRMHYFFMFNLASKKSFKPDISLRPEEETPPKMKNALKSETTDMDSSPSDYVPLIIIYVCM
jgi:hypothetical protein